MTHDEQQQPTDPERVDEAAQDTIQELSDESLENVSGGYYPTKTTTSPWGDDAL